MTQRETSVMTLVAAATALSGTILAIYPAYLENPSVQGARPVRLRRYDEGENLFQMDGNVAVIDVYGTMARQDSWISYYYGGTSTERLRGAIAQASEDSSVRSILFRINSPGGEIDGVEACTEDLLTLGTKKPCVALIEGMACSAAYWFACQCSAVYAEGATTEMGNIGVMATLSDYSKMYKEAGIERTVIASDSLKGMGTPGVPITAEQKKALQEIVDSLYAQFVSVVAKGRKLSTEAVRALGSRCFVGSEGKDAGLIDGIASYTSVVTAMQQQPSTGGKLVIRPASSGTNTRGRQVAASPRQENIMRDKIAGALLKVGLVGMAAAVMGASNDEPETLATQMATQVKTEAQEQLKSNPLLSALATANITTPEQLDVLRKNASYGETYVAGLREEAKKLAVVAFGVDTTQGKAQVDAANTMIDGASPEVLEAMMGQYTTLAENKGLRGQGGAPAQRQTAARELPNASLDAKPANQANASTGTFDMNGIYAKYR